MVIRITFCLLYVWGRFHNVIFIPWGRILALVFWPRLCLDKNSNKVKELVISASKCSKLYNDMLVNFAIEHFNLNCIQNIVFSVCTACNSAVSSVGKSLNHIRKEEMDVVNGWFLRLCTRIRCTWSKCVHSIPVWMGGPAPHKRCLLVIRTGKTMLHRLPK